MPFSLHVYPPAFSLPSIDAECLAAIAYLSRAVPRTSWTLVAESGPSEGSDLPCLRDGATDYVGFDAIVDHLRKISNGQWDLDAQLDKQQKADCLAFSSHLTQTLSPLIDLSLYICAENYDLTTRRAYGATLSFPESWAVPPKRQALAQRRTSHLGLSPQDLSPPSSATQSPESHPTREFDDGPAAHSAAAAAKTKASIASTVATSQRLHALIDQALFPLSKLHASNPHPYLLASRPSTLDCHALALLSLALLPHLNNPFLANTFTSSFADLETYTRRFIAEAFGPPVTASDALVRAPVMSDEELDEEEADFETYGNVDVGSGRTDLPWRKARPRTLGKVVRGLAQIVMS